MVPPRPAARNPFADIRLDRLRRRPGAKWSEVGPDGLAAWVADMDCDVPPAVLAAVRARLATGDLGYPAWLLTGSPLRAAFATRMRERHGWEADPGHVRELTDVVQGAQLVLDLVTAPGDGVGLLVPSYPPFLTALAETGRRLVPVVLEPARSGWAFDPEAARRDLAAAHTRVLLLVNPHNPTGRCLTRDELTALADLAADLDLTVVADEIHADLVFAPHRHVPFASLSPDAAARTVTLTSATKAFNLAGIRCAVAHVGDGRVRQALDDRPRHLYGEPGVLAVAATLAAWQQGDGWLAEVVAHLERMRHRLGELLADRLPEVGYVPPEATYLAWLDLRRYGLGDDPAAVLLERARVRLSPGPDFGPWGRGFARLNLATSRQVLEEIVDRLATALT